MNEQANVHSRRKRMHRLIIAALLTAVLTACGTTTPPADTDNGTPGEAPAGIITGTLTTSTGDAASNLQLSIGHVTTQVAADSLETMGVTSTDSEGNFAFDVTSVGTYGITGISDNEGVYFHVPVTRGSDGNLTSNPVSLATAPLGAVTGLISEERAGVMVSLLGTSFLALTDQSGAFSITRVPAGTYSVAATIAGNTGPNQSVTVKAGETTEITTDLTFGPNITSVTPAGITTLSNYDTAYPEFVITGSGFGDSIGVNRLLFAGRDITGLVTQWTDTRITVDINNNHQYEYHLEFTTVDDLRFTVAITGAEAHSPISAAVFASLWSTGDDHGGYRMEISVMNGFWFDLVPVGLVSNHGTLHAGSPDGPEIDTYVIDSNSSTPLVAVPSETATVPMTTTVSLDETALSKHVTGNHGYLELLNDSHSNVAGQPYEAELQLHSENDHYTDDGRFTYTIHSHWGGSECPEFVTEPAPFSFNNTGEATITIPAFDRVRGDQHCNVYIEVQYDSAYLAGTSISLVNDYQMTGIEIAETSPELVHGILTLNSGDHFFPEVTWHFANAPSDQFGWGYWTSSDPGVASYYTNGNRIQAGYNYGAEPVSATLTVEYAGLTDEITVIVLPYDYNENISGFEIVGDAPSYENGVLTLAAGDTHVLAGLAYMANGTIDSVLGSLIDWTTDNPDLVTVDASGFVTAMSTGIMPGVASITGQFRGFSDTITVLVTPETLD